MRRFTTSAAIAAAVCFAFSATAQAELTDLTGETYNWVSYNNNHTGSPRTSNNAAPAFTTDLTYDTDSSSSQIYSAQVGLGSLSGNLVDYGGTGNTAVAAFDHTGSQQFTTTNNLALAAATPGHTVFDDVLGSSYNGTSLNHVDSPTFQTITISGLDPTKLYDFVAISQSDSFRNAIGSGGDTTTTYGLGTINNADGDSGTSFSVDVGNGTDTLTGNTTDILRWDDIDPGADGIIEIQFDSVTLSQTSSVTPAIDSFAIGEVGAAAAIPEPSTGLLALLGMVGLGFATWRRRRR